MNTTNLILLSIQLITNTQPTSVENGVATTRHDVYRKAKIGYKITKKEYGELFEVVVPLRSYFTTNQAIIVPKLSTESKVISTNK